MVIQAPPRGCDLLVNRRVISFPVLFTYRTEPDLMTKISRALLQALRSCPLEELGFANCRQISTEAWQLLGLGCAWQLKKASFSRCGLVANFALGFGGFPILGDSLPKANKGTLSSPLLLKNLHEPTSLAWSQFCENQVL